MTILTYSEKIIHNATNFSSRVTKKVSEKRKSFRENQGKWATAIQKRFIVCIQIVQ